MIPAHIIKLGFGSISIDINAQTIDGLTFKTYQITITSFSL